MGASPPVEDFDLAIFGGTGDLALRKLLPALLRRFADGQISAASRIIAVARDAMSDGEYRERVRPALAVAAGEDAAMLERFIALLGY
ncbi:MAG TPA: glucose-6-phosphate dehydrogenase, partial [Rudaea sp.]|nr:glucose-6-phosphate dehydrogenase [Rudaea sp.]